MALEFGCTKRGRQSLLHKNFEYWLHRTNVNGTIVWYCCKRVRYQCKARVTTDGDRVIHERQPEHTHGGNYSTSLARKAVGEMKSLMSDIGATPSASQGAVCSTVANHVLMVYRTLHERVTRAAEAFGRAEILVYLRAMAHLSYT